ncbi:MAG: hypothetical protein ACKVS6_12265, partial [Planctomycetota bacterium]
ERVFAYRVDANNRLVSVSSDWLSFARENQASHLSADAVIGQPLFQFVTGKETQLLYQMTIDRVRQTQRTVVIPFRCDSPSVRRFMELVISPCPNGHVQFTGRIIREEVREAVPLLDPSVSRTDEFLVVCSWCRRVEVSGCWLEVELAVKRLQLFDHTYLSQISHGICADCVERVRLEVDQTS